MGVDDDLRGGGRFRLTVDRGARLIGKRGEPRALEHEAAALRMLRGTGLAPNLIAVTPGENVTELLDGSPRPLATVGDDALVELGRIVRRLHDTRIAARGGRQTWRSAARSVTAYARRRVADIDPVPAELRPLVDAARRAAATVRCDDERPFRLLHGDLVAGNIVWTPAPVLVDWEFWRIGDPAEDLAYLAVVNDLTPSALDRVLSGYGRRSMEDRLAPWMGICALDAAVWYLNLGDGDAAKPLLTAAERSLSSPRPGEPSDR